MSKQAYASNPDLPFSDMVIVNGLAYVSGQIAFDQNRQLIDGGIEPQLRATFENIKIVLARAGLGLEDIVCTSCYLVNREDLVMFNKVYGEYFTSNKPARSTVFVASLPIKGSIVEIDAVAEVSAA